MRLTELQPKFLQRVVEADGVRLRHVDRLEDAHGVMFLCPACYQRNGSALGTHSIICWRPDKVPRDASPGPGRWSFGGTGLADLTLTPSVNAGCWHGHIQDGVCSGA